MSIERNATSYAAKPRRGGMSISEKLKGVSDKPPTEPEVVVRITKQAKTTKLQRAILAGILGKT